MTYRPRGLGTAGRRLWDRVTSAYGLEQPESELLAQACKTLDFIEELRTNVAENGPIVESTQGPRINPAATEIRQQQLVLAKLISSIGLPKGELDDPERGR